MGPRFTGPLVLLEVGYELWDIAEPFSFLDGKGNRIDVEAGYRTDLASVPKALRSIVPKIGYWSQAAVIHDKGYELHREGVDTTFTRLQVDKMFRSAAKVKALEYCVPDHMRKEWELYHAVRAFSGPSWETPAEKSARLALFDNSDIIDN